MDLETIRKEKNRYPATYEAALKHRQANIFGVNEDLREPRDPDTAEFYIHGGRHKVTKKDGDVTENIGNSNYNNN